MGVSTFLNLAVFLPAALSIMDLLALLLLASPSTGLYLLSKLQITALQIFSIQFAGMLV
jgi:hypothetical protein